jgi:hypothetical protein
MNLWFELIRKLHFIMTVIFPLKQIFIRVLENIEIRNLMYGDQRKPLKYFMKESFLLNMQGQRVKVK